MSHQHSLSVEPSLRDQRQPKQQHPYYSSPSQAHVPTAQALNPGPEWIQPPAQLATVNPDAIDLNDEVFFNYDPVPSYTTEAFAAGPDYAAPSSSSSTANFDFNYTALAPHELAASPLKYAENQDTHYSHTRRFSSAVEQLNRMSLRAPSSSKSPSPDLYNMLAEPQETHEERTVNPKHLFGGQAGANIPDSVFPGMEYNGAGARSNTRYILPSSVSSPSLSTLFSKPHAINDISDLSGASELDHLGSLSATAALQAISNEDQSSRPPLSSSRSVQGPSALNNPLNPYVMNDECVSAITYWLNNTADLIQEKPQSSSARNSTGVSKPGWTRRNSIQVVSPRAEDVPMKTSRALSMEQKRRRRKSVNASSIPEISLPTNLNLNVAQADKNGVRQSSFSQLVQGRELDSADVMTRIHSLTLPSSSKQDARNQNGFVTETFDDMDIRLPETKSKDNSSQGLFQDLSASNGETAVIAAEVKTNEGSRDPSLTLNQEVSQHFEAGDDEPKPFPCPDCEKQFKRSEHLKRHIRSVHSNIRPFHCKYCEKKFSRSDNLAQHSKTHFKLNSNGTTTIIYGNPNPAGRNGRKKSLGEHDMEELS